MVLMSDLLQRNLEIIIAEILKLEQISIILMDCDFDDPFKVLNGDPILIRLIKAQKTKVAAIPTKKSRTSREAIHEQNRPSIT